MSNESRNVVGLGILLCGIGSRGLGSGLVKWMDGWMDGWMDMGTLHALARFIVLFFGLNCPPPHPLQSSSTSSSSLTSRVALVLDNFIHRVICFHRSLVVNRVVHDGFCMPRRATVFQRPCVRSQSAPCTILIPYCSKELAFTWRLSPP
jgi:hypothetical protein